jgi:MFS family permease
MVQIPLIFAGLTFVVGAAIMAGAVHIAMVIVGRLILGLGVGVGTTVSNIHHASLDISLTHFIAMRRVMHLLVFTHSPVYEGFLWHNKVACREMAGEH